MTRDRITHKAYVEVVKKDKRREKLSPVEEKILKVGFSLYDARVFLGIDGVVSFSADLDGDRDTSREYNKTIS